MSADRKGQGAVALGWWRTNLEPRDMAAARGLGARLRRSAPLAVLCEPKVQDLWRALGLRRDQADVVVQLAVILAEVRESDKEPLARRLGGEEPVLSTLRFQRLLRAEGGEVTDLLRRAITMADRKCNVAVLASDLLHWETARPRWCFEYFGADAPAKDIEEKTE